MPETTARGRNRAVYILLMLATIGLGLASRRFSSALPWWLAKNAGDALYATMVFWLAGALFPRISTLRAAAGALLFSFAIEFLQMDHAPWLEAVRRTRLGGLVLGYDFNGSDLVCYVIGVGLAAAIEAGLLKPRPAAQR